MLFDYSSSAYSWTFAAGSGAIIIGHSIIIGSLLHSQRISSVLESLLLSMLLSTVAAAVVTLPWTRDMWIVFAEAFLLSFTGSLLASCTPHFPNPMLSGTLASLWLALAVFDYTYLIFSPASWIEQLNDWLPSWLGIAAFGWLAIWRRTSDRLTSEVQHGLQG